jgi:hypothetical protein
LRSFLGGPLPSAPGAETRQFASAGEQSGSRSQDERREDRSTRDTANAPAAPRRVRRRSFIFGHTAIAHPEIARDIEVRVDADFERIFGSE